MKIVPLAEARADPAALFDLIESGEIVIVVPAHFTKSEIDAMDIEARRALRDF